MHNTKLQLPQHLATCKARKREAFGSLIDLLGLKEVEKIRSWGCFEVKFWGDSPAKNEPFVHGNQEGSLSTSITSALGLRHAYQLPKFEPTRSAHMVHHITVSERRIELQA